MLEALNVSFSYGGHEALHEVSLSVGRGETVVLLGANGAGKTTLLKLIAGLLQPRQGARIVFNGAEISRMEAHRVTEFGIALVPEGRAIFGEMTVYENLKLGAFPRRARGRFGESLERVISIFPRLGERRRQVARSMSGGEQQMLAIGRALMSCPDLLLLDEPSLGLSPRLAEEIFQTITAITATGVSILLVEPNARRSLELGQRAYILETGRVVREGEAKHLLADEFVVRSYLGVQ